MKHALLQVKKHWLSNLITFLVSLVIGMGILFLYYLTRTSRTLTEICNATAIATAAILLCGLLAWMAHFGVFDIFAFGFKQLGSMLFAKNPIRDGNFVDYKQEKAEKRSDSSYGFVAVVAAGLIFAIALVILDIVYFISM